MNNNNDFRPMFTHIGWNRWRSASTEWTSDEIAALYYCLWNTLDHTDNTDIRHDIVFLMEKLFNESEEHDISKALKND